MSNRIDDGLSEGKEIRRGQIKTMFEQSAALPPLTQAEINEVLSSYPLLDELRAEGFERRGKWFTEAEVTALLDENI